MIEKYYYSYDEFKDDTLLLANKLRDYNPDAILAIARGGCTLGHMLSEALNTRKLYTINSIHYNDTQKLDTIDIFNIPDLSNYSKVIIVDDIVDSGETIVEVLKILKQQFPNCEFKVATLFYKQTALMQPDFSIKEAKQWIDFFWEADFKQ